MLYGCCVYSKRGDKITRLDPLSMPDYVVKNENHKE
jgi:hypothetical protein